MSAKTRADRLNESADKLFDMLKESVRYDIKAGNNCPNRAVGRYCKCAFCEICRLIEYVDGKPLTL